MRSWMFLLLLAGLLQNLHCTVVLTVGTEEGEEVHSFSRGDSLPPLRLGHHICAQKADEGPCKGNMLRYYFNIYTQKCEQFYYGGCNGNDNNFETIEECQEKCIITEIKWKTGQGMQEVPKYCLVEADPGPCRGIFSRYFYNSTSKQCEKFLYGGCFGNENNFRILGACQNTCLVELPVATPRIFPQGGKKQMEDVTVSPVKPATHPQISVIDDLFFCKTPADPGKCSAKERRFFYNPSLKRCMPFRYTGCGGNENNFTSRKACNKVCRQGAHKKNGKISAGRNRLMIMKKNQMVQVEAGPINIKYI